MLDLSPADAVPLSVTAFQKAELTFQPYQVLVDAGRLPARFGEGGEVRHAIKRALSGHERHDGGLDGSAQA